MCGRVVSNRESEALARVSRARRMQNEERYVRSHNIPPTGYLPVITNCNCTEKDCNGVMLEAVKWGSKQNNDNPNARTETIPYSSNYLNLIDSNNFCCIIIDGYFEWRNLSHNKEKEPFFIKPTPQNGGKDEVFFLAGIYEEYKTEKGLEKRCIILTQDSCQYLSEIHDRMPVFLKKDEISSWLCSKKRVEFMTNLANLKLQNKKFDKTELTFYEVSNMVSKTKNTSELVILPKKDAPCDKNSNYTLTGFFNSVNSRKLNDSITEASSAPLNFKATSFKVDQINRKFEDSDLSTSNGSLKFGSLMPSCISSQFIISAHNEIKGIEDSNIDSKELPIKKSEIDFIFEEKEGIVVTKKRTSKPQEQACIEDSTTADTSIKEVPEKINKNVKRKKKDSLDTTKEKLFMSSFLQKIAK